jgi:hypothetical protein
MQKDYLQQGDGNTHLLHHLILTMLDGILSSHLVVLAYICQHQKV